MMDGHILDDADYDAAFGDGEGTGVRSGQDSSSPADAAVDDKPDADAATTSDAEGEHQESDEAEEAASAASSGETTSPEGESDSKTEPEPEDEVSKLRKQLRTQDGRASAADGRIKDLEAKLAALETQRQEPPAKVEIPEKLKKDAKEFRENYPGLYPLLEEASPDGEMTRQQLEDYGAGQAAIWAKSVVLDRKLASLESGMQNTQQTVSLAEHRNRLAAAHPETRGGWSDDPALQKEYATFVQDLKGWVGKQPEYVKPFIEYIIAKGSADQVNAVLDSFKVSRSQKAKKPLDADKQRRAKEAGAVDNRNPVQPPRGAPDPDDYQGALMEAFGLK